MLLPRCFTAMLQFCNARAARTTMTKECNKAFFHHSLQISSGRLVDNDSSHMENVSAELLASKDSELMMFDDDEIEEDDRSIDLDSSISSSSDLAYFEMRGCDFDEHEESQYFLGNAKDFRVSKIYAVPHDGFLRNPVYEQLISSTLSLHDIQRLGLKYDNITLPVALMVLDQEKYPTLSRARKACRKGSILLHKGPLPQQSQESTETWTSPFSTLPKAGIDSRVQPNDVIARQVRMGGGFYPSLNYLPPPFDLPVVYEDDYFAIVHKPPGIVVYSHRNQGAGTKNVRSALPFVLQPPKRGTVEMLRRPQPVHRLDRPTSGLLLVAKTKPAHVDLTRQFVERAIKKTYCAIVNGIPDEPMETRISAEQAFQFGVDVARNGEGEEQIWQLIDYPLADSGSGSQKSAMTIWRALKYVPSLVATQGKLTLVELKPKTGRYHQLRRHLSWVLNTPIVGDKIYDGGHLSAMTFRARGLFLCSNKVALEHPFYNSDIGRQAWKELNVDVGRKYHEADGISHRIWYDEISEKVMIEAVIPLPSKFDALLQHEEARSIQFLSMSTTESGS